MTAIATPSKELTLDQIRSIIDRADAIYHNGGAVELPDHEYDWLKDKLRRDCPGDPRLERVGAAVPRDSMRQKVPHTDLVGSVQNSKDLDGGGDYIKGFHRWAGGLGGKVSFICMPKLDGFSVVAYYTRGCLVRVVTRGDGRVGEDITANAIMFKGLPTRLNSPATMAVRGEAVLLLKDWPLVDPEKASNPRNLAAGIARRSDGAGCEHLTFYAFDVAQEFAMRTFDQDLSTANHLGINVVEHTGCDVGGTVEYFRSIGEIRNDLPYLIDGIVVRVAQNDIAKLLGYSDTCPKCMVAMKYPAEEVITTLKSVEWSVGHTGKLTPVGVLDPVQVGGVSVSNVTLCNMQEIRRLELACGDQVVVFRAGDVIPKLGRVHAPAPSRVPVPEPKCCPVCASPVQNRQNTDGTDTADLYCMNMDCPAKVKGKIQNWIKKLDIQGIGDEVLEAMMSDEVVFRSGSSVPGPALITKIADLYQLKDAPGYMDDLRVNGKRLGSRRTASILAEIDKTRTLTISQFLGSLGINHLGRRRVQLICEAFDKNVAGTELGQWLPGAMAKHILLWWTHRCVKPGSQPIEYLQGSILTIHADKLGVPGIAVAIQRDLDERRSEIEELLKHIKIVEPNPTPTGDGPLKGKTFCFTGCRATEQETARLIELGGAEKSGVSKGLSYLVTKEANSTSSKAVKARELGVQCISIVEFQTMLKQGDK